MLPSTTQAAVTAGLKKMEKESNVVAFEGYPDLLTVDNTAEVLQQSAQTVRGLCRKHELPSIRIGRRLYIPKVKLISYVESQLMEA